MWFYAYEEFQKAVVGLNFRLPANLLVADITIWFPPVNENGY